MLCLCVNGTLEEICVTEINKISSDGLVTNLLLKNGNTISVDDTVENLKKLIRLELLKNATSEPRILLHLYSTRKDFDYYPICMPVSAIRCVVRSYYSYHLCLSPKLRNAIPKDAFEKDNHQPAIITLNYPIMNDKGDLVEHITVYESFDYVMSFIKIANKTTPT